MNSPDLGKFFIISPDRLRRSDKGCTLLDSSIEMAKKDLGRGPGTESWYVVQLVAVVRQEVETKTSIIVENL